MSLKKKVIIKLWLAMFSINGTQFAFNKKIWKFFDEYNQ